MTILAVLLGGVVGTGLRLSLDALLPNGDTVFPWATFVINLVGSLALGFLVARVWPSAAPWLRGGLGTGLLGSFTTFSALIVSLLTLTQAGMPLLALVYLLLSLLGGLGLALLGLRLGSGVRAGAPGLQVDE